MSAYWRPDTPILPPLITTCVLTTANDQSFTVLGDREITIGRSTQNHVVVHDPEVAHAHARLVRTPAGLVIEDLGSANGTWVTRPLVPGVPHLLHIGDTIVLGRSRISFLHQLPAYEPPPEDVARLIAAICESPDDDEPRLVLADLLTARGDPRGEFISCQIAAESSVNAEAGVRADELLAAYEHAWLAPLPIPIASWTFRRGFLDCIWIHPGQSVAPLRGHHPLRAVVEVG